MPVTADPAWWIELIKVSPSLIAWVLAAVALMLYHAELRALFHRVTKFKGFGIEAEFAAKTLNSAIAAHRVKVSEGDRKDVLKRLNLVAQWLKGARILWVDDQPENNHNERALLEGYGVEVKMVTTSAEAEAELKESVYTLVITDLKREGNETEGLEFVKRTVEAKTNRWTIAYVRADQWDKARPPTCSASPTGRIS